MRKVAPKNGRAFTLIELIITIVLLGIAIPLIGMAIYEGLQRNIDVGTSLQSTQFVEQLCEEIRSRRFDENTIPPWSAALGGDGGETRGTWDDIDDYDGLNEPVPGFSAYAQSVNVQYAPANNPNGASLVTTDYKRIRATVTPPRGVPITITFLMVGKQ